jgi:hypothetical protein
VTDPLLPTDDGPTDELYINFTDKEATSAALDPVPAGKYHVAVTDISLKESQSEKNKGKPFWAMEYTVQGGQYENRKIWSNVMLFSPALFSLSQMMKAVGLEVSEGQMKVPAAKWWLGKEFVVRVVITPPREVNGKSYDARNDVKAYYPLQDGAAVTKNQQANSLLP